MEGAHTRAASRPAAAAAALARSLLILSRIRVLLAESVFFARFARYAASLSAAATMTFFRRLILPALLALASVLAFRVSAEISVANTAAADGPSVVALLAPSKARSIDGSTAMLVASAVSMTASAAATAALSARAADVRSRSKSRSALRAEPSASASEAVNELPLLLSIKEARYNALSASVMFR